MWHYLTSRSRVMMSNGKYRDACNLFQQDRIASYKCQQTITEIKKVNCKVDLIRVRTNNWHSPFDVLESQCFILKQNEPKDAFYLDVNDNIKTPTCIKLDMLYDYDVNRSYYQGYVIGTYLVVGFYKDSSDFGIHFTSNDRTIVESFVFVLNNAYPNCKFTKSSDRIILEKSFASFFKSINPSTVKLYNNKRLLKGIYDGIIDNIEDNYHFKLNREIYEIISLCSNVLEIIPYGKIVEKEIIKEQLCEVVAVKLCNLNQPIVVNGVLMTTTKNMM